MTTVTEGRPLLGRPVETIEWNDSPIYRLEQHYNIVDYSSYRGETVHMVSSGVNFLRPPSVILRSIAEDARDWKYINCYCGPLGESVLRGAALVYEESVKGSPLPDVECALTVGAAEGIRLAFEYLRDSGVTGDVLVAGPQYSIVHQTVLSARLRVREVWAREEGRFLPGPAEIAEALDLTEAKVLFLTEPNNPSGEQHTQEEFEEIVHILSRRGTHLVLDKISSDFAAHPGLSALNYGTALDLYDYWDRTICVDSLAKRRAVSGLRFGYVLGPQRFVDHIENQRFGGCPPLVAVSGIARDLAYSGLLHRLRRGGEVSSTLWKRLEHLNDASLAVLSGEDREGLDEYAQEIDAMYGLIFANARLSDEALAEWRTARTPMHGGFNHLVRLPSPDTDDLAFGTRLFDEARVACYPLQGFAADARLAATRTPDRSVWLRMSCATERPEFERTIEQMRFFLNQHSARS
ncbi:pyridoxal phosphate-dependent aminotransferase [Streptomyces paradoxus]|uniref:pyridoxal phosphate-dependent aminotransferase n=1 Tax=Streptomyces paradoxus TaxID=66375 RepID=UPI00381F17B1